MQVLRVPPPLWPTVTAWLPPETPEPGALTRMHKVVRLLLSGSPTGPEAGEATGSIIFSAGGRTQEVLLGPDWFLHRGQRYSVPNLAGRLRSLLHAG